MATRIRDVREMVGLAATELSTLAGLSHGALPHFERGDVSEMKFSSISSIATVLGARVEFLMTGEGEAPTKASALAAVEEARRREAIRKRKHARAKRSVA